MNQKGSLPEELKEFVFKHTSRGLVRCFWPSDDCNEPAIKAHSIQNSRILDQLTDDGHVVMPVPKRDLDIIPTIEFAKVGRNKATTFTGLCGKHDNAMFQAIDNHDVDFSSSEQLFLLAYRSVLKGLHASMKAAIDVQGVYMKGMELGQFDSSEVDAPMILATQRLFSTSQFYRYKAEIDNLYQGGAFSEVRHATVVIESTPCSIAVSSVFCPGNLGSDGDDPAYIVLNVFPRISDTCIVFSYLPRHHQKLADLINMIKAPTGHHQLYLLSKLVLRYCENLAIAPKMFSTFSDAQINALKDYFVANVFGQNDYEDPKVYLFGAI